MRNTMKAGSIAPTFMSGIMWAKNPGPSGQHEEVFSIASRCKLSTLDSHNQETYT